MSRKPRNKAASGDRIGDIILALTNKSYDYRTARGIATQLHIPEKEVAGVLSSDNRVRASVIRSRSGDKLYTLKEKTSLVGDYIKAFRALSSDKMGSYDDAS